VFRTAFGVGPWGFARISEQCSGGAVLGTGHRIFRLWNGAPELLTACGPGPQGYGLERGPVTLGRLWTRAPWQFNFCVAVFCSSCCRTCLRLRVALGPSDRSLASESAETPFVVGPSLCRYVSSPIVLRIVLLVRPSSLPVGAQKQNHPFSRSGSLRPCVLARRSYWFLTSGALAVLY